MRNPGFWRLLGKAVIGWIGLGALVAANYFVFDALDSNYVRWYIGAGSTIALATIFLGFVVEVDGYGDLISANPFTYLGAVFRVLGTWFMALSTGVRPAPGHRSEPLSVVLPELYDTLASAALLLLLRALLLAWLLVVVPAQYFVFLLAGAPARLFKSSGQTLWADGSRLVITDREAPGPPGAVEISVAKKPVRLTNAFAAILLFGASYLV